MNFFMAVYLKIMIENIHYGRSKMTATQNSVITKERNNKKKKIQETVLLTKFTHSLHIYYLGCMLKCNTGNQVDIFFISNS